MKKIVGIIGKIGAGKSTLISFLEKAFPVLSIDKIQDELYQEKNQLWHMVKTTYPEFINNGKINKDKIKEKFIKNAKFKYEYQEKVINILILHLQKQLQNLYGIVFIEIPYINSDKLAQLFDLVVIVKADEDIRIKRISERDGISIEKANIWVKSFVKNIEIKKSIIIENNNNVNDLEIKLTEVFKCLIL